MRTRLTDNDRKLGPLVYGKCKNWSRSPIGIYFVTSDSENSDKVDNFIRFWCFGWVANLYIPTKVKPYCENVSYKESSYKACYPKKYGFFSTYTGIKFYYGLDHPWELSRSKSKYISYTFKEWRWTKTDMYDGNEVCQGEYSYDKSKDIIKTNHKFIDYDGKEIIATVFKKVYHYKFGGNYFKWLSRFVKDKKHTVLDIEFSEEVGPDKTSWKGGTLGHGIEMENGETQDEAFIRYCSQTHMAKYKTYNLKYVGKIL